MILFSILRNIKKNRLIVILMSNVGSTCMSPQPCMLASSYQEAKETCSEQGLELCKSNENLNDICCGTGCVFNSPTIGRNAEVGNRNIGRIFDKNPTNMSTCVDLRSLLARKSRWLIVGNFKPFFTYKRVY